MKLLVTGAQGQLGSDVLTAAAGRGIHCIGVGRGDFDITDFATAKKYILDSRPDAVIHCAAYNKVDLAEENTEICNRVNFEATANIAAACRDCGAKLMMISTDYVFDGAKQGLYEPEDAVNPLSVYGRSKAAGEAAVQEISDRFFIVRTSWLYGKSGGNFVKTMLQLSRKQKQISVVDDQIGSPTYTVDLAPLLLEIAGSEKYGIYHATNEGFCSWAQFADEIMRLSNAKCKVNHVTSAEYAAKAPRPKNSRLSKDKLLTSGFYKLPLWQDSLRRYLEVLK